MTQQEFYDRTRTCLSDGEFWTMHEDYCKSGLDKDEYCREWLLGKYRESNAKVTELQNRLVEINRDMHGTTDAGALKTVKSVRRQTMQQLYQASRETNTWRDRVFATDNND